MKTLVQKTEAFLEWGGIQKEIALLAISGAALVVSIFDLLLDGRSHDVVLEADYPLGGRQAFGLLFDCRANVIECRNLKYGIPTPVRITRTSEFKVRDPYGDQEWSPTFEFSGDWRVVE